MRSDPATTPRKTPVQRRSQETVGALLIATTRVLVEHGYEKTTTNRVAETAGTSIGTLYQYFPNKEALVGALVDHHAAEMQAVFMQMLVELGDAPVPMAVRTFIRAIVSAHRVNPELHRVVIEQLPRIGGRQRLADFDAWVQELVRQWLETRRGEVRPPDLGLAAFLLCHAVEAMVHATVLERTPLIHEEGLVDEIARMVVAYLV